MPDTRPAAFFMFHFLLDRVWHLLGQFRHLYVPFHGLLGSGIRRTLRTAFFPVTHLFQNRTALCALWRIWGRCLCHGRTFYRSIRTQRKGRSRSVRIFSARTQSDHVPKWARIPFVSVDFGDSPGLQKEGQLGFRLTAFLLRPCLSTRKDTSKNRSRPSDGFPVAGRRTLDFPSA